LRDDELAREKIEKRGEVLGILREIAFAQLNDTVAKIVYERMDFGNLGSPPQRDLANKPFSASASFLFDRISSLQHQICDLKGEDWCAEFERKCEEEIAALRLKWDTEWIALCDGKRFFRDLHSRFKVRVS